MQLHPGVLDGDEDLRGIDDRGRHAHHGVIRVRLKQEQARTLHLSSLAASGKQIAKLRSRLARYFLFSFSLFRLSKIRGKLVRSHWRERRTQRGKGRPRRASHLGRVRNARRAQQSYGTTMTESIGESHLLRALSRLSILEEEIEDSLPARKRELKRLKRRASRRRSSCNNSLIVGSSLDTSLDEPRPRTRYALHLFSLV